jgi:hypothetical protein
MAPDEPVSPVKSSWRRGLRPALYTALLLTVASVLLAPSLGVSYESAAESCLVNGAGFAICFVVVWVARGLGYLGSARESSRRGPGANGA